MGQIFLDKKDVVWKSVSPCYFGKFLYVKNLLLIYYHTKN